MASRLTMQGVTIPVEGARLMGTLTLPQNARSLVLFAHGSGSSRFSPRNRYVAAELNRASIGTMLMDLLSEQEDTAPAARFDIDLLATRLAQATDRSRRGRHHRYPLATWARARAPLRRSARRGYRLFRSRPSFREAGGPISPDAACSRQCTRLRCWWSAGSMLTSSNLIARRSPCSKARRIWSSFPARRTCLRSPARWKPSHGSLCSGSSATLATRVTTHAATRDTAPTGVNRPGWRGTRAAVDAQRLSECMQHKCVVCAPLNGGT